MLFEKLFHFFFVAGLPREVTPTNCWGDCRPTVGTDDRPVGGVTVAQDSTKRRLHSLTAKLYDFYKKNRCTAPSVTLT